MSKFAQPSWDDVRFVLAVADHGSVSAAADVLSVNHATVLRRIAGFEARQGIRIFEKTNKGYRILADRRALVEAMRDAGEAFEAVDQLINAERPGLTGGIRITSTDTFSQLVLPSIIAGLGEELRCRVEILMANTSLNFGRLEAHVTVRPTPKLPSDLTGERAGAFRFGIYARDKNVKPWLSLSGRIGRSVAGDWMRNQKGEISATADSFLMLAALAAEGQGRAILPVFLGDRYPNLERVGMPQGLTPVPLWVASHRDFAKSGRLVRARKFIANALIEKEDELMG